MSKALLALNEMPENCLECRCLYIHVSLSGDILSFCGAPTEKQRECVNDYQTRRPDWCPLKPIPEKKKFMKNDFYVYGFVDGWNECLREIEGDNGHE